MVTSSRPKLNPSEINRTRLGKQCGVDTAYISRILNKHDKAHPSFPVAVMMAKALGVSTDELAAFLEITADDMNERPSFQLAVTLAKKLNKSTDELAEMLGLPDAIAS